MSYSICLLTAALTAGGPADCTQCQQCATCQPTQVIYQPQQQVQQQPQQMRTGILPALRARIDNLRHKDSGAVQQLPAQQGPQVVYTQPMPQGQTQVMYGRPMPLNQPPQMIVPASATGAAETITMPEVKKQFQAKIGAADDYAWITGQLFYVHVDGGRWVLRYAAIDQEDKFGGSVVLAPTVDMKNFREGDLVSVNGEVLSPTRATRSLGGPLYRVDAVNMIERADR